MRMRFVMPNNEQSNDAKAKHWKIEKPLKLISLDIDSAVYIIKIFC